MTIAADDRSPRALMSHATFDDGVVGLHSGHVKEDVCWVFRRHLNQLLRQVYRGFVSVT
jgi:hypothetical protein